MGHGRPQRWPDPGRHPFIPAPFSLHCYSSGSVTVAERKILAGCPVKHERCWPTIWLSSLPNTVNAGWRGRKAVHPVYSQLRETVVWFMSFSVNKTAICSAAGGQLSSKKPKKYWSYSQRKDKRIMMKMLSMMSDVFIMSSTFPCRVFCHSVTEESTLESGKKEDGAN